MSQTLEVETRYVAYSEISFSKYLWNGSQKEMRRMKVSTEPSLGERLCLVLWSMLRCLCKNELHFSKVLMGGVFTQNPDLWITLLGIHSLTYNRTSCFSMAHGWSWGTWLGLVTSSQFGPSLIGHCSWEVFYAKSLEFIMLPYFLCWILYFFF